MIMKLQRRRLFSSRGTVFSVMENGKRFFFAQRRDMEAVHRVLTKRLGFERYQKKSLYGSRPWIEMDSFGNEKIEHQNRTEKNIMWKIWEVRRSTVFLKKWSSSKMRKQCFTCHLLNVRRLSTIYFAFFKRTCRHSYFLSSHITLGA